MKESEPKETMKDSKYPHLARWEHPQHYFGATYCEYFHTGVSQHRDSDCIGRANFAAMLEKLGGESETVIVTRAGHWAVGWVESILIHESDDKALDIAESIMADFDNYPVIDDDILSEVEQAELESTVKCYGNEFRETLLSIMGLEGTELSKRESSELDLLIQYIMDEDRSYHGAEEAFVTEESAYRYAERPSYWDDTNALVLLRACLGIEGAK